MIKLQKLIKKFKLETVYIPKEINIETYRFETAGTTNGIYELFDIRQGNRLIVWGFNDEIFLEKIKKMNEEKYKEIFSRNENSKIILVSRSFNSDKHIEFYKKHNYIVMKSPFEKYELLSMINNYISHKKAEKVRVHGSLVNVFGEGVLIVGKSGIGKSELVVDLINAKHSFVADDAVDITEINDRIIGQSAEVTKDFIELRGVGIINVRKTFGIKSILKRTDINLVVELVDLSDVRDSIDRLGNKMEKYIVSETIEIPKIQLPVSSGRTLLSIIESAVTVYKHKKYEGYTAIDDLSEQLISANLK